ncbi:MAG: YggS family pyridoxal phosphate-dependent enzyme [Lachnospiraceae bacterium]|nr:YggS family pyridoxal phosphate-dependent enzyme [Lachnospiraceae bacterium]
MIQEYLSEVEANIQAACQKAGRNRDEVTLIAVSKTQSNRVIQEAYDAGLRVFGENKVQELVQKYNCLPKDIAWHMIGHLQTNKVKSIVDKAVLIHSVDSLRLAEVIERECAKHGIIANVLLEVNVAEEKSKFGFAEKEVKDAVKEIAKFQHISIQGLMTIAPFVDNAETNRPIFSKLRKLLVDINREKIDNVTMRILSMGMTNDYRVAIEEGATMVRIGTGVFGARYYGTEVFDKN